MTTRPNLERPVGVSAAAELVRTAVVMAVLAVPAGVWALASSLGW